MKKIRTKLTVYFDGTFWIGIFEKNMDNKLYVSKYIFGSEPKDIEIYNLILNKYKYIKYSMPFKADKKIEHHINPKRMKRIVHKQVTKKIGTKSQQAIKLEQESRKVVRKKYNKEQKEEIEENKYLLKKNKKIEKHKGR